MTTSPQEHGLPLLSGIAGRRIRGMRAELGLSQNELAMKTGLGLSRSGLSDRESGVKPVNVDELPAFAAALGVSVAYLMGFTDDRSRPLEGAASDLVRQQGLEPRTRWLRVAPALAPEVPVALRPRPVVVPFARPEAPSVPAAASRKHLSLVEEVAS